MRFLDKNQTLVSPESYLFRSAAADGAYLRLTYYQSVYKAETTTVIGENIIVIYLNDMGREVGRSVASYRWPEPIIKIVPAPRKFRFRNGFLIARRGIWEMLKCLKN